MVKLSLISQKLVKVSKNNVIGFTVKDRKGSPIQFDWAFWLIFLLNFLNLRLF